MVRKLCAADNQKTAAFLLKFGNINTYMIGYILRFGYDKNFCEVFGAGEDNISAVILRFYSTIYICAEADADYEELAIFISMQNDIREVSGTDNCIKSLMCWLTDFTASNYHFLELRQKLIKPPNVITPHIANSDDINDVYELLLNTRAFVLPPYDEFYISWFYRNRDGRAKTYLIKKDEKTASTASVLIKSDNSAMIGAVATDPLFRGFGFAGSIVSFIAEDLISEGYTPCIIYENEAAGRIYKKLGFEQTGIIKTLNLSGIDKFHQYQKSDY